jgi:hypothetical protein
VDIDVQLGDFTLVGCHNSTTCKDGKVFRQTPQKINGYYWPPSEYTKPNVVLEWHWCMRCHGSTRSNTLNMSEVKTK